MRKIAALVLVSLPIWCFAQNLVPNPSFEEYFNCPNDYGESFELRDWFMAIANPDYFNVCDGTTDTCGVPNNFSGFQNPASGDGYIGMITYSNDPPDGFRELLGVKLTTPLVPGTTYYASFKISCTNGYPNLDNWTRYAANKLGVRIRQDSLVGASWYPSDNIAQFSSDSIVTDSVGWTLLSGTFVAQEIAQWLYLGNFFDNTNVSNIVIDPSCPDEYSYYYFDDVCLSLSMEDCPLATATRLPAMSGRIRIIREQNGIKVSGLVAGRQYSYEIRDTLGRLLLEGLMNSDSTLYTANLAASIIVLRLWDGGEVHRMKILVP